MAYAHPSQGRRIVVVAAAAAPPPIDPRPFPLSPPPPPPPPPPIHYITLPVRHPVPNPTFPTQVLLPANPPVVVVPRSVVRWNPAFWIQIDERRAQSLLQFMANEGLEPSPEEEMKRKELIDELKKIVLRWIKRVAWQRGLPKELIASMSATILTYGSYGLGVHGPESDIDALCVGPHFASLEEDFFVLLRKMLENTQGVSEIHSVKSAKVPLIRFKFRGISVDLPYAEVPLISVSEGVNIFDPYLLSKVNESSWRSLSGVHANTQILQLVPNLKNFQSVLRCIKLWAKRRGVYSHLLGFFGGIHLAILAALVCQRFPNASVNALFVNFFGTFSQWPWPNPVILQDPSIPLRIPDSRSLMPIMLPCYPFEFCNSNITRSTFKKIKEELQRGFTLARDLQKIDLDWSCLFEVFPYATWYTHFIRILLATPAVDELYDWLGWVKSRFRSLLLKLESMQFFCDPNPTEYTDHSVTEPNIVFYWGLSTKSDAFIDIDSVKEAFMNTVNNDTYTREERRKGCVLDLSVIKSSQLPKNMQIDSGSNGGFTDCQRISDFNYYRQPVYMRYLPQY